MENASKALLIAGAVLIVILLIGVGMMVFNGSKENVDAAMTTVSAQQIQVFNGQFAAYEGEQTGANVRALNQAVKASNAKNTSYVISIVDASNTAIDMSTLSSSSKYNVKFSDYYTSGHLKTITVTAK